jgi:outer membrane receptor for ferrienterochelin and colicins
MGDWSLGITLDGFYTQLTDVFILEEQGMVGNGDLLLERRNGSGATVAGVTINPKVQYKDNFSLQFGLTFQNSEYDEPVQWSESVENTSKRFFRTPDQYGFYVLSWNAAKSVTLNLSGVYTGGMIAQHYAGYIAEDVLETTPSFFENNFKIDFTPKLNSKMDITFNAGIQNFTNAYQDDFDLGIDRDAGYIYGPGRPRTYFLGMNIRL